VFLVSSPSQRELKAVLRRFRSSFKGRALLTDGEDALVVLPLFEWRYPPSVTGIARKIGVFVLPPVLYADGRETYRVLAPGREVLRRFLLRLRRLGDVELLSVTSRGSLQSIRELPLGSIHFLEGLTQRQTSALIRAFDEGLLDVPARDRWDGAARREGLSRSTFGEHLRKGQWRLVANAYAGLKSRVAQEPEPVLLPKLPPRSR
jgi:predicted DNA binding protein